MWCLSVMSETRAIREQGREGEGLGVKAEAVILSKGEGEAEDEAESDPLDVSLLLVRDLFEAILC